MYAGFFVARNRAGGERARPAPRPRDSQFQPPCLHHLATRHREGVVPQGLVAEAEFLAESELEGELALPVMGVRRVVNGGCQLLGDRGRRVAGQRLLVARIVSEGLRDLDGLALRAVRLVTYRSSMKPKCESSRTLSCLVARLDRTVVQNLYCFT